MSTRRKKIPEKAPVTFESEIPLNIRNPVFDSLKTISIQKPDVMECWNLTELSCKVESTSDFYRILEENGYFLPALSSFTHDWAQLVLRGEKVFLKKKDVKDVRQIWLKEFNWEMLTEMMKSRQVLPYVWFDGEKRPDFDYLFRVIATQRPEWYKAVFAKKNETEPQAFVCKEIADILRAQPSKNPSTKTFKKLGTPQIFKRPDLEEFEKIIHMLRKNNFQEADILKFKLKLISNVAHVEQIARGEKELVECTSFTSMTQIVPMLKALNSGDQKKVNDFMENFQDANKWERCAEPARGSNVFNHLKRQLESSDFQMMVKTKIFSGKRKVIHHYSTRNKTGK